jgi:hypothetical protein
MPKFPQRNEEELLSTPKHKTSVAKAPAATIHEDATMHVLMVWPPADIEKGRKSEAATARQREAAAPDRRTNALPDRERLEVAQTCGWASAGHGKKGHMHFAQSLGDMWKILFWPENADSDPVSIVMATRCAISWNDVAAARHSLYDRARESEASIWGQTAWPCSSPLTLEDVFSSYRACNKIDMRGSMLGAPGRLEKACRIMAAAFLHA